MKKVKLIFEFKLGIREVKYFLLSLNLGENTTWSPPPQLHP